MKKIIIYSLITLISILPLARIVTQDNIILTTKPDNTIPIIDDCDKLYGEQLDEVLKTFKTKDSSFIETAKQYMVAVKQQYDLELKIRHIEDQLVFDTNQIAALRLPLTNYTQCRNLNLTTATPA